MIIPYCVDDQKFERCKISGRRMDVEMILNRASRQFSGIGAEGTSGLDSIVGLETSASDVFTSQSINIKCR